MRIWKQGKNSDTCLACVAAMAFDSSPSFFRLWCKKNHKDCYDNIAFMDFGADKGFWVDIDNKKAPDFTYYFKHYKFLTKAGKAKLLPMSTPAMLLEKMDGVECDYHALYWTGKDLIDPDPRTPDHFPWDSYKITMVFPIHVKE